MSPRRLFLALYPPLSVRGEIGRLASRVMDGSRGRRVSNENLHLTLSFLGDAEELRVEAIMRGPAVLVRPFCLKLGALRWLARRELLLLEPVQAPPDLFSLHVCLARALSELGFAPSRFTPHVTLARGFAPGAIFRSGPITPIVWAIDRFSLVESVLSPQGAKYSVLATWPLGSIPPAASVE